MKLAYILSGGTESTRQAKYRRIGRAFESRGFTVRYVEIRWLRKNPTDWINQFISMYKPGDYTVLFGFSWGAWTAFVASTMVKADKLVLCSLSPYFKEDRIKRSWIRTIGKMRYADFKRYSFKVLNSKCKTSAVLLIGGEEHKNVLKRVREAHRMMRGSKLLVVPESKHEIADKNYMKAIVSVIDRL